MSKNKPVIENTSEAIDEFEYELTEAGLTEGYGRSGEEGLAEEDQFSLLGSSDDAEKQRMYVEYLALIKDIECQNKMVADIKAQLSKLCSKDCKTSCEVKNIRRLHNCLEQENLKLQCLINKAIALQNFGSKRHYRPIPIETSFDEDNLLYAGAIPPAVWKSAESTSEPCDPCDPGDPCRPGKSRAPASKSTSDPCTSQASESEDQSALMCQVMKALQKMGICCDEDKQVIKKLAAAMLKKKDPPCKPKKRPSDPCKKSSTDLISPNVPCPGDSVEGLRQKINCVQAVMRKLKEQMAAKERDNKHKGASGDSAAGERLRKRLSCLQGDMSTIKREIARKEREAACGAPSDDCIPKLKARLASMQINARKLKEEILSNDLQSAQDMPHESMSLENLREKICQLQSVMIGINNEIAQRQQKSAPCWPSKGEGHGGSDNVCNMADDDEMDPVLVCGASKNSKADQLRKLKDNYLHLLSEFAKKDVKLKELEQKLKGFSGPCKKGGGETNDAELDLLRCRMTEMREEQDEFKCIMKEQAQQLEDYRQKYLNAQQKVEEQSAALEKLNMNNKRIEKQINTEVKEIRAKFQEKLNELLQYPKLLENEQCKLAHISKERDELQTKLTIICKELRNIKSKQDVDKPEDCRPALAACTLELEQTRQSMGELQRQRDLLCEELQKVKDDLDTLRCESAKIIARTKERADQMKQYQQDQINRLEKELAQCRACACLSVSDRETVIKEMQGQLNTLSFSFDAAQKQIKTLRNHIAFVSNDNCFPIKC